MKGTDHLLTQVLREPRHSAALRLKDWDLLVRQARHANLLARLWAVFEQNNLLEQIPERPRNHFESAHTLAERQQHAVRWEVNRIQRALAKPKVPVILLKGAAYIMAGLPVTRGRLFADVDIMVPKETLTTVEQALLLHGWVTTHLDPYDQRYYRTWMHELPPLAHIERRTLLDVHHAILPETARLHPDPDKLRAAAIPLKDHHGVSILAPVDMVLHSATHLFHDGELENGLRDLVDLDGLLRHFSTEARFWPELTERAEELELTRPLYYALRYTHQWLGTPVPESALQALEVGRPKGLMPVLADALFNRGLAPNHASCDDRFTDTARWLLYVRSHYLRMPLHLLVPHLVRKAIRRRFPPQPAASTSA